MILVDFPVPASPYKQAVVCRLALDECFRIVDELLSWPPRNPRDRLKCTWAIFVMGTICTPSLRRVPRGMPCEGPACPRRNPYKTPLISFLNSVDAISVASQLWRLSSQIRSRMRLLNIFPWSSDAFVIGDHSVAGQSRELCSTVHEIKIKQLT